MVQEVYSQQSYLSSPIRFTRMFSSNNCNQESWKLGHLNHVAIAVPDLKKASEFYKNILGAKEVSEAVPQPEHGVYTVFVNLGNTKIELLHPYGDKSPIQNFLDKNKNGGIHHVCIEVDDVKIAIKDITSKGIRVLDPEPKIGAHGNPVVFLHPKDCNGVLVELEEVKKS
ncbi:7057_t:CDS:2, partial [Dentiscutata heterogama]